MQTLQATLTALTSQDETIAQEAAQHLPHFGQAALTALGALLESEDEDTRWWALYAISHFSTAQALPHLILALKQPTIDLQRCAALALHNHVHPSAIPHLIAALNQPDNLLQRLAANALAAIGGPATDALLNIAVQPQHNGRLEAVRALAMIADPRSISTLFNLLDGDSALVEYWASEGLDAMGIGMTFFNPGS